MKKVCYINLWAGVEKMSHLSNRNETKWSKTNLFAYLCSYKSLKGVTMTGNSNVFKTISKNGNKEHDDKYISCFFMIWNLIIAAKYKFGRLVLFFTSVNHAISQLTPIFFHVIFKLHYTFQRLFLHCIFHVSPSF